MNIYAKSVRNGVIQSSSLLVTLIIVIPLAFNFDTSKSYDAWIVAIDILPDPSMKIATLDPSGNESSPHIVYQSEVTDEFPSSLLTWIGPNVFPFAFVPISTEVSLIVIISDDSIIWPEVDPVLICSLNFSVPSVILSAVRYFVMDVWPGPRGYWPVGCNDH